MITFLDGVSAIRHPSSIIGRIDNRSNQLSHFQRLPAHLVSALMRAMLTPPYHFGIVAAPIGGGAAATPDVEDQAHILYRGAFPAARNAPFLNRLGIKTLVCLRKKAFSEEDPIVAWAVRKGIDVQWIKAERMSEESLGMERDQVNDVLQVRETAKDQWLTTDTAEYRRVSCLPRGRGRHLAHLFSGRLSSQAARVAT